jgi:hypothetical protein
MQTCSERCCGGFCKSSATPHLQKLLGKTLHAALRSNIDSLQFQDAVRLLEEWGASATPAIAAHA